MCENEQTDLVMLGAAALIAAEGKEAPLIVVMRVLNALLVPKLLVSVLVDVVAVRLAHHTVAAVADAVNCVVAAKVTRAAHEVRVALALAGAEAVTGFCDCGIACAIPAAWQG